MTIKERKNKMRLKSVMSLSVLGLFLGSSFAWAAEGAVRDPYGSMSAAFAIAIAAFGGALAQAKAASSALDGIGRNPAAQGKLLLPMIIALGLIESLVLYAFVIALLKT
jgi:F0F1-type ATP synthase membrane subunit c/vacuolar-type H+-ATPase subunit K